MIVSLIAAMAANQVIGNDSAIPWHIPGEQKRFKEITTGHYILMGRKTYEAIGRALPQRTNIVITRQSNYQAPDCIVVQSLDEALKACPLDEEVFICGGGQLYARSIDYADRIYLTVLHRKVAGNVYFPEFSHKKFELVHNELVENSSEPYTFKIYKRKS